MTSSPDHRGRETHDGTNLEPARHINSSPSFSAHSLPLSMGDAQVDWWPPGCGTTRHPFANTGIIFLLEILSQEDQCYSWPGCSASGGKGERSTVIVFPPGVCFKRRRGTPEPASHGADQPEFLRQGSRYEHLFLASTSPDPLPLLYGGLPFMFLSELMVFLNVF